MLEYLMGDLRPRRVAFCSGALYWIAQGQVYLRGADSRRRLLLPAPALAIVSASWCPLYILCVDGSQVTTFRPIPVREFFTSNLQRVLDDRGLITEIDGNGRVRSGNRSLVVPEPLTALYHDRQTFVAVGVTGTVYGWGCNGGQRLTDGALSRQEHIRELKGTLLAQDVRISQSPALSTSSLFRI